MPRLANSLAVALLTSVLVVGLAGTASAHVTVGSSSTNGGSSAVLTFKVPVESATASTVGLTVALPTDHPFTSVLAAPVAGWTVQLTTTALPTPSTDDDGAAVTSAVTQVTWTATAGGLTPGQFGQFQLSVSPLPAGGTLYLPAIQRYSDGTRVDWVQQAQGAAKPEHPAPSVVISPAAGTTGAPDTAAAAGGDGWGIALGVAAIVLALVAGGLAGAALTRARTASATAPGPPAEPAREALARQAPEAARETTDNGVSRARTPS